MKNEQCDEKYYEADKGFMCWINKEPCSNTKYPKKQRLAKEYSKKVIKHLKKEKHKYD